MGLGPAWPFKRAAGAGGGGSLLPSNRRAWWVPVYETRSHVLLGDRVAGAALLTVLSGPPPSPRPHPVPGHTMAQTDILLTKEPAPQTVPACQLPRKLYDVARNTGAHMSSGLATAGFRTAKYLVDEWFQNCYARYHQAFADLDQSERQHHESQQLVAETEALAQRTQQDSTKKVGQRLKDMHCWKSELQRQVEELVAETDLLLAQKQRLERTLDATAVPFSIATDNLQCRERRQHPDLVRDCVEMELLKVRPLPAPRIADRAAPPLPREHDLPWAESGHPCAPTTRLADALVPMYHVAAHRHREPAPLSTCRDTQAHAQAQRRWLCL